ncbi:uncharacterized protein PV09_02515 [Verruconis gallopava]|uniref:C2H2-type domain-containing protein n=1 Tax=Verruconis gallopava TaxID=253628 RepID=A0A0D2AJT5_9PEZI|nr:uncharacterized protein PV09_02515 [Verruconis gallopava]KIW06835.1 hypothetical protein PV09_02515 [Verruconis gallopava]
MDGRNALGRRISLLNEPVESLDAADVPGRPARLTSLAFRHSRTSSFASSPNSSPPTPELVRSDSSDSSAMNRTPSPTTPNYIDYSGLQPTSKSSEAAFQATTSAFFNPQVDPSVANYPPIPPQHAAQFTYPAPPAIAPQPQGSSSSSQGPHPHPHPHPHAQGPASLSDAASSSTSKGPAKQATKKNSYPCPLAKQFNCNDHFTTSGHAARHAKKHTGKKDAFCPECNKAFTRKDNMEQHRRTHQNGRNAAKSTGESAAKRQKTSKRANSSTTTTHNAAAASDKHSSASLAQSTHTTMTAAPGMLDPSLPHSPASSFGFPEPTFSGALNPSIMHQYPDPMMPFSAPFPGSPTMLVDPALGGQMPNGMANGLDTLAMAAAKRDEHY